jgi:hypothetical protein
LYANTLDDLDVEWFGNDVELRHFGCTKPVRGNDENEDAFGFDFGPYDQDIGNFSCRHTIIVRETAGGGFMLLIEDAAFAFANKTRALFELIVEDTERKNPEST